MPDARLAADGTLDFGITYSGAITDVFATMAVLPRLEATFALLRIESVQVDPPLDTSHFRQKALDLKFIALLEGEWWPQVAIGATDLRGSRPFRSQYLVASKRHGEFDFTLGFGAERIDGPFGGLRWRPGWARGWAVTLEHDANDYANEVVDGVLIDPRRDGGLTTALEYDGGWWGLAATAEDGERGGRAWLRFPFGLAAWSPKPQEPPPPTRAAETPRASTATWGADRAGAIGLAEALYAQDYDSVDIALDRDTLLLQLSNNRISHVGRAVGRAARTALLLGPADLRAMRITYEQARVPIATYAFSDLAVLRDYFAGRAGPDALAPTIKVTYAAPADATRLEQHALLLAAEPAPELGKPRYRLDVGENARGNWLAFERYKRDTSSFQLKPLNLDGYFDGATSAFRYDLFALARYNHELSADLQLAAAARLTLLTDLDGAPPPNDSTLPHVRSDIALYRNASALKLESLFLSQQTQLGERLYGRFSAGVYEEMFVGMGGQLLYLPANGAWATDLTVDYARQRDYDGWGLLDYDTITALAALHWRLPSRGLSFTGRAGRFLAGDTGLRFEAQRRLKSGVLFGFWYSTTDGHDINGPGSPSNPYQDKGLFLSIPLALALPYDSRARASVTLAPWNRDGGAMLRGPGDLYAVIEDVLLLNTTDYNPLSQFGR